MYAPGYQQQGQGGGNNLQFYSSNYAGSGGVVPGPSSSSSTTTHGGGDGSGYDKERLTQGWLAALGTGGYSDELPLLEELGVNFSHIKDKTLTVLNPFGRIDQHIMDDSDMAGPILFCLLFGITLLLSGKSHFGYIYGVALLGTISLHAILNMMALHGTEFIRTASVLGYCLLPLVVTGCIGLIVPSQLFNSIITIFAILWCTYAASGIFVSVLNLSDMRFLVAYPLCLFYSVFAIMSLFVDKAVRLGTTSSKL